MLSVRFPVFLSPAPVPDLLCMGHARVFRFTNACSATVRTTRVCSVCCADGTVCVGVNETVFFYAISFGPFLSECRTAGLCDASLSQIPFWIVSLMPVAACGASVVSVCVDLWSESILQARVLQRGVSPVCLSVSSPFFLRFVCFSVRSSVSTFVFRFACASSTIVPFGRKGIEFR